jgi:hypothetical protein
VASVHPPGKVVTGCRCVFCEEKRRKWRERDLKRRGKDNPFARSKAEPSAVAGPKLAVVPSVASADGAAAVARPFVPWTVDVVRPLVQQAANLLEKWDGETLMVEARKVSARVAEFVQARLAWNAEAKTMLVDGGAECAVKYLNLSGISAEYLPEIKFGLAALSIVNSRQTLVAELRKMAEEEKAAKKPELPKAA